MIAPTRQVGQRRFSYCIVFLAAFAALCQMLRLGCGSAELPKEFISKWSRSDRGRVMESAGART
jgi:hypothetical protein